MKRVLVYAVAACACVAVAVQCGWTQETPAKIGVVDLEVVGQKFQRKAEEEQRLTQWYVQEQQYLRELSKYVFSPADEWEEVAGLLRTPKVDRKKEQGDRLQVLLELCTNRERQYQDLRAKPERTAEEDGTFKTLDEIGTMRDADLNKRIDALEEELGVRTARVRADLMVPVRSVVNTIAAERGFLVVLEKDWVYFGGEDITEDVVKRLNETVAPPTAGAQPAGGGEKPKEGDGAKPGEGGGQQP